MLIQQAGIYMFQEMMEMSVRSVMGLLEAQFIKLLTQELDVSTESGLLRVYQRTRGSERNIISQQSGPGGSEPVPAQCGRSVRSFPTEDILINRNF